MKKSLIYPLTVIALALVSLATLLYQKRQETASPLYPLDTSTATWHQLSPELTYTTAFITLLNNLQSIEIPFTATDSAKPSDETATLTAVIVAGKDSPPLTLKVPTQQLQPQGHLRLDISDQHFPKKTPLTLTFLIDQPTAFGFFTKSDQLVFLPHYPNNPRLTDASPFNWPIETNRLFTRLNHQTLGSTFPIIPALVILLLTITFILLYLLAQVTPTLSLALLLLALAYLCF